ncbi:hypothetical protein AOLI_G00120940 [Acnodon oligacanthus]
MVCREQWSRDQWSVSWISEGNILCKFISHCAQASQLVNGTAKLLQRVAAAATPSCIKGFLEQNSRKRRHKADLTVSKVGT